MSYTVAGIDIHKKVLMVVVAVLESGVAEWRLQRRRFGTGASELTRLVAWLRDLGVEEAVMESTAQYWKPALQGRLNDRGTSVPRILRGVVFPLTPPLHSHPTTTRSSRSSAASRRPCVLSSVVKCCLQCNGVREKITVS